MTTRLSFQETTPPGAIGNGQARTGLINTPHGEIQTPVFMPVGTQGTVKGVLTRDLEDLGAEIILGNTYHLWLRPGAEILRGQGGLRKWMNWKHPLLTDSGGFQVFSLSDLRKWNDDGVEFKSHLDGTKMFMTPETSIAVQEAIASTIMMQLDICPALPADESTLRAAVEQSSRWAERCLKARTENSGALFGIVQGGLDPKMRREHLARLASLPFEGLALGGFSVGESPEAMADVVGQVAPDMPRDKPRYLMGVGRPEDLLNGVMAGVDMFDCVMPSRNARNGTLFTSRGKIHIPNAQFASDSQPVDPNCRCTACRDYSASYLRHLHKANEILASVLGTIHNLHFYVNLMKEARVAIRAGNFLEFRRDRLEAWKS